MPLSETQKGAIAENLIANWLMAASNGRLSPYKPVADDSGVDLLVYDRETKRTILFQVKARTHTEAMVERGRKTIRLNIRLATFEVRDDFYIVGVLLSQDLHTPEALWLIPSSVVEQKALRAAKDEEGNPQRLVVACSSSPESNDQWSPYRTHDTAGFIALIDKVLRGERSD